MKKQQIITVIILSILGMAGVLSLLGSELPLTDDIKAQLLEKFSQKQISWLILVNPTLFLGLGIFLGMMFYKKAGFSSPYLERLFDKEVKPSPSIIPLGITGGIIAGILIVLTGVIFMPIFPEEFLVLSEKLKPSVASRILYGGLTEEIMMRFGLMTFLVWLTATIFKTKKVWVYWTGILLSSLLFAAGHFNVAFMAVENPSVMLLTYIMIGNSIGGIIFGWLYWKKGLESAMIAHIFAHLTMLGYTLV